MVMQYFQFPLAAFQVAVEFDRNRYGDRKKNTVRPETAKGAVADLYYLLDQSGGEVSYSQRFWGRRWEWNPAEVDRLLKMLTSTGILSTRKKRDGSRCLTRSKTDVSTLVSKNTFECKQEFVLPVRQNNKVISIGSGECNTQISTVFSNNPIKEKRYSPADLITAAKGGRKKQLSPELSALFLALYTAYGDKRGRAEAAWAFTEIPFLSRELVTNRIIPAAKDYASKRPALETKGLTPKMLQFWITAMRWEDFDPTTTQAIQGTTDAAKTRAKYLQEQEA
jgi:hypothetical protein